MNNYDDMTAAQAIALSVQRNRTLHLAPANPSLREELISLSTDCQDTDDGEGRPVTDIWGYTDKRDSWRVMILREVSK